MFRNVARFLKSCDLHVLFLFFFSDVRIMCIEMLHVSQRVKSIHLSQTGYFFV